MEEDEFKEPFSNCPKCGYQSGVALLPKQRPIWHFYCPECGHKEAGTASYPLPDEFYSNEVKELKLIAKFSNLKVGAKEQFALKKLFSDFKGLSNSEIKEKLRMRSQWVLGVYPEWEAEDLIQEAEKLGLKIEKHS